MRAIRNARYDQVLTLGWQQVLSWATRHQRSDHHLTPAAHMLSPSVRLYTIGLPDDTGADSCDAIRVAASLPQNSDNQGRFMIRKRRTFGWADRYGKLAGVLLCSQWAFSAAAQNVDVWIGTTTPKDGVSKGIYHASFNPGAGTLTEPQLAAEVRNPGFLTLHPALPVLYSVGKLADGTPVAMSFLISRHAGQSRLTQLNVQPIGDGGATHLATDREGKCLLTAQYGGGSVAAFPLDKVGAIKPRSSLIKHAGASKVVASRQENPHAHWVGVSPDNRFAFVPDLGMDQVAIYKLDPVKARLISHGSGSVRPGSGPRHMKFHPNGKVIYVLNELAMTVSGFDYDSEAGTMNRRQTIPTIPEHEKAKERFASGSEIRVHPTGRFVFAANRGHDTITVFDVDAETGQLTWTETEPIRGSWPRNFNLDPTGRWLVAAGRDSHTLSLFEVHQDTGELTFARKSVFCPTPICVLFAAPPQP